MGKVPSQLLHNATAQEIDELLFNQSKREETVLQDFIEEETPEEIIERLLRNIPIEEARAAGTILDRDTGRSKSRVLFITEDQSYLNEKSLKMIMLRSASVFFDEVHVLVLSTENQNSDTKRVTQNIWTYRAGHPDWTELPNVALGHVHDELEFGGHFRPDIVVGLDPFVSGLTALKVARAYGRPHQIHILSNYFANKKVRKEVGYWKLWAAWYVLRRTPSVRVINTTLRDYITKKYRVIKDLDILPQFYNFKSLLDMQPSFDVHERYKVSFLAITFATLTADSKLHDVFTAMHTLLRNPAIGLVVIGDGPAKSLFTEKAKLLGIEKNVLFLAEADDLISYLKTADLFIETETAPESETRVLRAAAAGLPLIMYETEQRLELFEDGTSAGLVKPGDVYDLEKNISQFLNNFALRVQYKEGALSVVEDRLEEDPITFYRSYRDTIELALVNADAQDT